MLADSVTEGLLPAVFFCFFQAAVFHRTPYTEYYYYILEAKIVLHPDIIVSIMTEFVENTNGEEAEKQDCERNAYYRLMGRLKKEFPRLPIACAQAGRPHPADPEGPAVPDIYLWFPSMGSHPGVFPPRTVPGYFVLLFRNFFALST